MKVMCFDVFYT